MSEQSKQDPPEFEEGAVEPQLDPAAEERRRVALKLIRSFGDPVLRAEALAVERFDERLKAEIDRMFTVMKDAVGVGLAATQLGIMHRVFVYRSHPADEELKALVNAELVWTSEEPACAIEGCLSLPGVTVNVERPAAVRVRGQSPAGDPLELEANGLEARVIQHELDHLDGVLILDRASKDERREAMRILRGGAPRLDPDGAAGPAKPVAPESATAQ